MRLWAPMAQASLHWLTVARKPGYSIQSGMILKNQPINEMEPEEVAQLGSLGFQYP